MSEVVTITLKTGSVSVLRDYFDQLERVHTNQCRLEYSEQGAVTDASINLLAKIRVTKFDLESAINMAEKQREMNLQ